MPKSTRNAGKPWEATDKKTLKDAQRTESSQGRSADTDPGTVIAPVRIDFHQVDGYTALTQLDRR